MRRGPVSPYSGRLIVRLKPSATAALLHHLDSGGPFPASLSQVASVIGTEAAPLVSLLDHPAITFKPAVQPQFAPSVRDKEAADNHTPGLAPLRSLLSYFIVDSSTAPGQQSQLASQLSAVSIVDLVQREPILLEPAGDWAVVDDDYNDGDGTALHGLHTQGYTEVPDWGEYYGLNCATDAVWGKYSGAGVGFIDLEAGWHLTHADLPAAANPQPLYNKNCQNDLGARSHGTLTLGVVLGIDDAKGVVGIAPQATFHGVVSRATIDTNDVRHPDNAKFCADLTGAIVAAGEVLSPGDVLLLEVQTLAGMHPVAGVLTPDFAPVEIVDLWFDAIRYASGIGLVVIEPAGNGTFDLDNPGWAWDMGGRSLDTGNAAFQDSGAIMVSACSPRVNDAITFEHDSVASVNSGSRIDCYGWTTQVGTTDVTNAGVDTYYGAYSGTSAASAMIAGAAILVQEMATKVRGTPASPTQIRLLLSASGTPVKGTGKVVPDLSMVVDRVGALSDVFVRDSVDDDGSIPSPTVSMSPDIIIRHVAVGDPEGVFGDGSGFEDAFLDNDPIVPDQPNYVYVRVRNRSVVAADSVRATVYWADTMTMVPPSEWSEIDTTAGKLVPGSAVFGTSGPVRVLGPITWHPVSGANPPQYPAQHGCLVAVIDAVDDPRPAIFPSLSNLVTGWTAFTNTIGANNNIAFRNFDVLPLALASDGLSEAMAEFIIPGAPQPAAFELVIRVADCPDVHWELLVPIAIAGAFPVAVKTDDRRDRDGFRRVPLESATSLRIRDLRLGSRARHKCLVRAVTKSEPRRCSITIAQRHRGLELGRVTFAVGARPPRENPIPPDERIRRTR